MARPRSARRPVGGVRFLGVRPSSGVPPRRREVELSVERPLGPSDEPLGVVRLTARFDPEPGGGPPPVADLKAALADLVRELDSVVGPPVRPVAARPERGLAELIETYRPRQRELIDLLLEEGEISPTEHAQLAANLPAAPLPAAASPRPPSRAEPAPERPAPAAPTAAERGLPAARPVPELLRLYQIATLRQAGAVRARRQISFAEYMALKRHFEASEPSAPG